MRWDRCSADVMALDLTTELSITLSRDFDTSYAYAYGIGDIGSVPYVRGSKIWRTISSTYI